MKLTSNYNSSPSVIIHPNPVKAGNHISFSLNNIPSGNYTLTIADISGKALYSQQINHKEQDVEESIYTNDLIHRGIYIFNIKNDTLKVSAKMMVE